MVKYEFHLPPSSSNMHSALLGVCSLSLNIVLPVRLGLYLLLGLFLAIMFGLDLSAEMRIHLVIGRTEARRGPKQKAR